MVPTCAPHDSVWHPTSPGVQLVWDATSIKLFMECPEKYRLSQIAGWKPGAGSTPNMHLTFGSHFGEAIELFLKLTCEQGIPHEDALLLVVKRVLELARHPDGSFVYGIWEDRWKCAGTVKYRNEKGNVAKCPYALKHAAFPAPGPQICGKCGADTIHYREWLPYEPTKDIYGLLRLLVWYIDDQKTSFLRPMTIETNGKHMVLAEVPFRIPAAQINGDQYELAGWFDTVKTLGSGADANVYICDYKTTKSALGMHYWRQYNPNPQVSTYDLMGTLMKGQGLPYQGVAIEAFQLSSDGMRSGTHLIVQTEAQRAEFKQELMMLWHTARAYNEAGMFPKNRTACVRCEFHAVCSSDPNARPHILKEHFRQARWNPLTRQQEPVNAVKQGGD